jgi:hypothetical protein
MLLSARQKAQDVGEFIDCALSDVSPADAEVRGLLDKRCLMSNPTLL